MVDNSTVDLQIPQGPITLTSIPSQGVSINSCFTHNFRGQSQDEKSHSKEYDHRAELSRWEVCMLKQLPQGSSRNDCTRDGCDKTTDGLPSGPAQECVFFSRKAFKDLEDATAQHDSNNEALKKAKDWPIQKAKQGEKVSATGSSGTSYL